MSAAAPTGVRFIGPLETALHLRSLPLLKDLPPCELAVVTQQARERSFPSGTEVLRPGEPVPSFHVVVEGALRARGGEHGDERVGPGGVVGLLTLLARDEAGLQVVAEEDSLTLEIDADQLADVFEDQSFILHHQIQALARQLLEEREQLPDGAWLAPAQDVPVAGDAPLDLVERLMLVGPNQNRQSVDALVALVQEARELRFPEGELLWRVGDPSGFSDLIVDGSVTCRLPQGQSFRCGRGYPLGDLESVAAVPRWYDATAEAPLRVLRSRTEVFLDLLEDHFEMATSFLAGLAASTVAGRRRRTSTLLAANAR